MIRKMTFLRIKASLLHLVDSLIVLVNDVKVHPEELLYVPLRDDFGASRGAP